MGFNLEIPQQLSHLKIDSRGYPIPFFVTWIDGKPEFRFLDHKRQEMIIEKKLYHICGKKLNDDYNYFISGPIGFHNRISSDAAMHRVCAEFSLRACPHLYLQKADRRENDELAKEIIAKADDVLIKEKPQILILARASKFKPVKHNGNTYIRYTPVSFETFHYVNGKLEKKL
jgi:hypothetical protein